MIRDLSQDTTDYELGTIVATILGQDNWISKNFQLAFDINRTATITNYIGSRSDIVIPSVFTRNGVEYTITQIPATCFSRQGID